jgi:hypothetical protein
VLQEYRLLTGNPRFAAFPKRDEVLARLGKRDDRDAIVQVLAQGPPP